MRFDGYLITQALSCVSLTAGSLGLFLHSAPDKSVGWRYLSDSSYWVYIVHLPLVLHLTWICLLFPIPLTAYPVAGLLLTLIVSYASYEFLVRTTWLGKLLNGRRYGAFLRRRKILGAAACAIIGGWGLSASALQDASIAERDLGGALHCLPPNLGVIGVLQPESLAANGLYSARRAFVCPERRWASEARCHDLGGVDIVPAEPLTALSLFEALEAGHQYWVGITDHAQEEAGIRWSRTPIFVVGKGEPNDYGGDEDVRACLTSSSGGF